MVSRPSGRRSRDAPAGGCDGGPSAAPKTWGRWSTLFAEFATERTSDCGADAALACQFPILVGVGREIVLLAAAEQVREADVGDGAFPLEAVQRASTMSRAALLKFNSTTPSKRAPTLRSKVRLARTAEP